MRLSSCLVAAIAVIALAAGGFAADSPPARRLAPVYHDLPAGVEILRLDNGLEVVLLPNPAQPMVGIYCQVKVGSAWEDFATSGMTHMLEHLLFNGTEKYTQEQLYETADLAGAYNNAHTTDFYTDFMMVLPAERLETGLDLQSQMLLHSVIPPEAFAKEQGIVLGELVQGRDRDDPFAEQAVRQALYGGSSLELPALGTTATIAAMQRDDVHAFYRRWYVPNNMVLTLAGRFDRDQALALVQRFWGEAPPRSLPRADLRPAAPIESTVTFVRKGGAQRKLALGFAAPDYRSIDHVAFRVATELLAAPSTGILARAFAELPEASRPAADAWSQGAPGFARVVLEFDLPAAADPGPLYGLVQDAIAATLEAGVSREDLAEVVAMARTGVLKEREQLRMTGIHIAEPLVLGGPDYLVGYPQRLAAVTPADVERVLRTWLVDRPCVAVLIEPAITDGDAPATSAASTAAAIERAVLPGGAVLVSETTAASDLMAIHLTVRDRALLDQRYGRPGALNLVHRLLPYGAGGCDEDCLARRLRRLGAEIKLVDDPRFPMDDYYTNGRFSFIRVECPATSGAEVLALVVDLIQRATFDAAAFAQERAAMQDLLGRRESTATWQAQRLLAQGLYRDHPLAAPAEGTTESLAAISLDELRELYRRAFLPANLVLAVVSPFTVAELRAMIPAIDAGAEPPAAPPPSPPVTEAPDSLAAHVGGPMGAVRLGAIRALPPVDAPALDLLVAVLADHLVMDLRETRGLSYSAGAAIDIAGERAVFTAWLNPPVERLAEGEAALAEALRAFDPASVSQAELDAARSARQGRLLMRRLDSISRAYYLAMSELGGDVTAYLRETAAYDAVTLADLQRVGEFFRELPLVTVVVD
ncbi:MAG TPA: insulinase family protein [Candidatus Krumholzibacteria bacterium]|nr:insulinase family protein [Candidatus Krumholzibacteria bacterium]HPD71884.1 insulinase family protein [Candidatus Krumholzibacteria bacterium]HRY41183.1 insulinase family protein [Candidatus Krumholzibacteria bacterium]